jgi:hypothetical protein
MIFSRVIIFRNFALHGLLYRLIILSVCAGLSIRCQAQNKITFRVDMSRPVESGLLDPSSGDRVILRSSFNSWTGGMYIWKLH